MKQSLSFAFALAASTIPASAQKPGPIKIPGIGTCPDKCTDIRTGSTGALVACCGEEADGCTDCTPECVAICNGGTGFYGACTSLEGVAETTCTRGCEIFCDSTVSNLLMRVFGCVD
jgi:hypothetical protein